MGETKRYSGGCACGAVRYEIDGAPIFQNFCKCRDCQRRSGTGHGAWMTFPNRQAAVVTGSVATWSVAGDSGSEKHHAFCPRCGCPVHLTFSEMPDLIAIAATSLDDPGRFAPQAVTYGVSGLSWDRDFPDVPVFERMPTA